MSLVFKEEIDKLDLSGLKNILKDLKLYESLIKELGERGIRKYRKLKTGRLDLSVEYYPSLSKDYVLDQSIKILDSIFGIKDVSKDSIRLIEIEDVKGGIRLFVEDKVLDLTYSKIEKRLI